MIKCKSAKRYKGLRPPRCNGGHPCETCRLIYLKAQARLAGVIK